MANSHRDYSRVKIIFIISGNIVGGISSSSSTFSRFPSPLSLSHPLPSPPPHPSISRSKQERKLTEKEGKKQIE
jgi:hypothetical protein